MIGKKVSFTNSINSYQTCFTMFYSLFQSKWMWTSGVWTADVNNRLTAYTQHSWIVARTACLTVATVNRAMYLNWEGLKNRIDLTAIYNLPTSRGEILHTVTLRAILHGWVLRSLDSFDTFKKTKNKNNLGPMQVNQNL